MYFIVSPKVSFTVKLLPFLQITLQSSQPPHCHVAQAFTTAAAPLLVCW
jgi:hypothetical protein